MYTRLAAFVPLLLSSVLSAQNPIDPVGDWQGTLKTGAHELRLVLHVKRDGKQLTATLDSIDQGAHGIPVESIELQGKTLTFEMRALKARFEGVFEPGSDAIDGTFTQGVALPLRLARTAATPVLKRPQMPRPPFPYRVEEVRYAHVPGRTVEASFTAEPTNAPAGSVTLAGTLTLPAGDGPFPAVVLISGSGPQDRDESLMGHKPFLVLADHLSRNGIAVLRYDDRGVGASTGRFREALTTDFADDAEAGLRYLLSRKEIAADKVGLIGHSEGGLVAPLVAARHRRVAFVVLLAGPGVPGADILALQSALIARANGMPEPRLKVMQRTNGQLFDLIRTERDDQRLRERMRAVLQEHVEKLTAAERKQLGDTNAHIGQQVARLTTPWMLFFLRHDPRPVLARLRCPVLALNGSLDLQVDAGQNLPAIREALQKGGLRDFEVVKLPGLNHLFQHARTGSPTEYSRIEETFAPAVLERITRFIRKRCAD